MNGAEYRPERRDQHAERAVAQVGKPELEVEADPARGGAFLPGQPEHGVHEHEVDRHVHHRGHGERPDEAGKGTRPWRAHMAAERQVGPARQVRAQRVHGGVEQPLCGRRAAAQREQGEAADERGADRAAQDDGGERRHGVGGPGKAARAHQGGGGLTGDEQQAKGADLAPVDHGERTRGDHDDGGDNDRGYVEPRHAREPSHASPSQPAAVDPDRTYRRRYPQETPEALIGQSFLARTYRSSSARRKMSNDRLRHAVDDRITWSR